MVGFIRDINFTALFFISPWLSVSHDVAISLAIPLSKIICQHCNYNNATLGICLFVSNPSLWS